MENVTNILSEKKFNNSRITIENRKKVTISGVEKALSSNSNSIILMVSGNKLFITGQNLHIEKLDVEAGVVEAEGEFDSFKFNSSAQKGNFIKRIFK